MGNNSSFCVSASHKCPPLGFFTSAAGDVAFAPSGRWLFFFSCGSRLNSALVQCDLASCPPTGRLTSHTWPLLCLTHERLPPDVELIVIIGGQFLLVLGQLDSTQSFVFYVCFLRGSSPCWQILFLPSATLSWLHLNICDTWFLLITSWFLSSICSQVSRPFSTF